MSSQNSLRLFHLPSYTYTCTFVCSLSAIMNISNTPKLSHTISVIFSWIMLNWPFACPLQLKRPSPRQASELKSLIFASTYIVPNKFELFPVRIKIVPLIRAFRGCINFTPVSFPAAPASTRNTLSALSWRKVIKISYATNCWPSWACKHIHLSFDFAHNLWCVNVPWGFIRCMFSAIRPSLNKFLFILRD